MNFHALARVCCVTLHPQNAKYTPSFSGARGTLIKSYPWSHEASVDKCQIILSQTHNPYQIIGNPSDKFKLRDI